MIILCAMFRKPLLASALALAGLGAVGQAHATAYSFAHVELKNFQVVFDPALTTPTLNRTRDTYSAASYTGYVPTSDTDPQRTFTTSDALQSFSGPGTAPGQNTWAPALTGTNYGARADAYSIQNLSQVVSVAESNVVNNMVLETGAESANNTGVISFSLAAGETARVAFNMQTFWDLAASVTEIDDFASASGSAFFILSETTGGSTSNLFRFDAFDVSCASGAGDLTPCVNQSGGFLTANSGWSPLLDAGTYRMNLRLEATGSETALPARHVPEPATISLLGAGLVGLAAARRRKAKAKADTEAQA